MQIPGQANINYQARLEPPLALAANVMGSIDLVKSR